MVTPAQASSRPTPTVTHWNGVQRCVSNINVNARVLVLLAPSHCRPEVVVTMRRWLENRNFQGVVGGMLGRCPE